MYCNLDVHSIMHSELEMWLFYFDCTMGSL